MAKNKEFPVLMNYRELVEYEQVLSAEDNSENSERLYNVRNDLARRALEGMHE